MNAPPEYYFAFTKKPNGDIKMFVTVTKDRTAAKVSVTMEADEAAMHADEHDLGLAMIRNAMKNKQIPIIDVSPSPAKPNEDAKPSNQ